MNEHRGRKMLPLQHLASGIWKRHSLAGNQDAIAEKRKEKSPKSVDIYTQSLNQASSSSVEKVSKSIKKES